VATTSSNNIKKAATRIKTYSKANFKSSTLIKAQAFNVMQFHLMYVSKMFHSIKETLLFVKPLCFGLS